MSAQVTSHPLQGWLRREWRLLLGLLLSAVSIYLAVRGISLPALKEALITAQWQWVLAAIIVVVIGTFLKAWRWQAMFFPKKPRFGKVWSIFVIGQMLNTVLPARAGEISRIYFIGEEQEISRANALSTVVVEKLVDLVMLAIAYLIMAGWLALNPVTSQDWLQSAGLSLLLLAGLALLALLLFAYAGRPVWRVFNRLLDPFSVRWKTKANDAVEQAITGFEVLRRWKTSALIWGLAILIWTLSTFTNVLVFHAYHIELSPWVALVLIVVLMSGVAAPPLPGNVGVFPYLCQLTLALFGIDRETALVYGITLQMVAYLPLFAIGSVCLIRENWSLRRSSATRNNSEPNVGGQ